jgi:branched-chain amino acid transport system ATP-binding protein
MILGVSGLSAGYGAGPVLHGIDLTLQAGEIVTLVGANGAGKSTLAATISGLMRPLAGKITFDGADITALGPAERLRRGLCHVPEGRQVFAGMTVRENLLLGGRLADPASRADRLDSVCRRFPVLRERLDSLAGNFSGGQQQMLAIARGMMASPRLILLDEPSLGLSPLLVGEMFRLVQALRDDGLTILLAEQNARAALSIADRGYVIENGRVALSGPAAELLRSPDVTEKYLGGATPAASNGVTAMGSRLQACIA